MGPERPRMVVMTERKEAETIYEEERHETNLGILWRVKCVVDGIEIGEAMRANKQTANNVAAWTGAKKLGLAVSDFALSREIS